MFFKKNARYGLPYGIVNKLERDDNYVKKKLYWPGFKIREQIWWISTRVYKPVFLPQNNYAKFVPCSAINHNLIIKMLQL